MSPLLVAGATGGALVLGAIIGYLVALGRTQRALERIAADQHNTVGLYLRRKVAEAGIDPGDAANPRGPEAALRANVSLAESLLHQERRQIELGDTQELGLARTMRLKSTGEQAPVEVDE